MTKYFILTFFAGAATGFIPFWLYVSWEWRKIEKGLADAGYKMGMEKMAKRQPVLGHPAGNQNAGRR